MMTEDEPHCIVLDSEESLALWKQGRDVWNSRAGTHRFPELKRIEEGAFRLVLRGVAAMTLWQQGKETWNAWVKGNPRADVDFSDQYFEANAKGYDGKPLIDFSDFRFPDGDISFIGATFRDGNVTFDGVVFGEGVVAFREVRFGNVDVSFVSVNFGEGEVQFDKTTFGKGDINFEHAEFGSGSVSFDNVFFGQGRVGFDEAIFGDGDVSFDSTKFGKGNVSFNRAKFCTGDVSFYGAKFDVGDVSFRRVDFGEGAVTFLRAEFGRGDLAFDDGMLGDTSFDLVAFGCGSVSFRNVAFGGIARFNALKRLQHCTQFSFEGCSFDKLFTFSHGGRMGCPLDLRRTKLTHGVVLNDVKCDYVEVPVLAWPARLCHWFFAYPDGDPPAWQLLKRAADPEDSQRFRRLKELALSENNRAKALEFNAQELRSQRGHESHPLQDFLQFFYMLLSDYGRSVVRPLWWLAVVTGLFGALYAQLATKLSFADALPAGFTYSGGNMFAFVPIGRNALEQSRVDLFGNTVPYELLWIGGFQSVLSVILLFLLGLGLRNMFRL